MQMEQKEITQILVDNQAAISIAKNPVFHGKNKILQVESVVVFPKRSAKRR